MVATFSELGSHWVAYERKMLRGVVYTLIWNIPFCAALVEWRAPWRHFLAGILFCSGIVTTFCAFSFNLMAVAGVVAIHGGTVLNLLFGKNDGNQRPVQTKT